MEPVAMPVVHVVDVVVVWHGLVAASLSVFVVVLLVMAMLGLFDLLDLFVLEGLGVLPHPGRDRRHRLLL